MMMVYAHARMNGWLITRVAWCLCVACRSRVHVVCASDALWMSWSVQWTVNTNRSDGLNVCTLYVHFQNQFHCTSLACSFTPSFYFTCLSSLVFLSLISLIHGLIRNIPAHTQKNEINVFKCNCTRKWYKVLSFFRHMFPVITISLRGLDPARMYSVWLNLTTADDIFSNIQSGTLNSVFALHRTPTTVQPYMHPFSPMPGLAWMKDRIAFSEVRVTLDSTLDESSSVSLYLDRLEICWKIEREIDGRNMQSTD